MNKKLSYLICLLFITQTIAQSYDYNTSNVCDTGSVGKSQNQVAYMCTHQALGSCQLQQAVQNDGFSSFAEYGFGGYGSNPQDACCRCFQIQVQGSDAPEKDIIVQGINTGGDVNSNQFDLSMIAGGFGANNGCANKVFAWNGGPWDGRAGPAQYSSSAAGNWCSDPTSDNSECKNAYSGGIVNRSDCSKLPNSDLVQLCQYSFDTKWRTSNGNRDTLMKEVRCPAGLIKLSGCNRDDSTLPYPTKKLSPSDSGVQPGKLTHMWDCCKPSCSWVNNVSKANGTAVMSCDATGNNILGTNTSPFQCVTLTCDSTCKSCSASNDANKCTACNNGFFLSSNPGKCTACTAQLNCSTCSNSTTCSACKDGYTLQNDGSCQKPCDASCKTCSTPQDATSCTSCNQGFYLNGNTTGSCSQCPQNCTACTNNTTCSSCTNNSVLVNGVCQLCESPCKTCKTNTTTCTDCISGYSLNGNTCVESCHSSCKTCSKPGDASQCSSCNTGFYLSGNTVGQCNKCSDNCQVCNSANSCQTCNSNSIFVDGKCQQCTSPCQTCQDSVSSCLSCIDGYKLNGSTCTVVNSGDCHSSCATCSKPNDQNYCTSCYTGYMVIGGNCQPCQKPCKNCSGDPNSCTACVDNYTLNGKTCVGSNTDQTKCHASCKTCSVQYDQNACTSCFDGYLILGNNNCQPCQKPCKNCSGDPNSCTECIENYSLNGKTCVGSNTDQTKCHASCKTCSVQYDQNACTSCFDGYLILGNGNCQPCQPPCKNCSGNPNTCTACSSGQGVLNGTCVDVLKDSTQCDSTCQTCTQANNAKSCASCMNGFTLSSDNSCQASQFVATVSTTSNILRLSLVILIAIFTISI